MKPRKRTRHSGPPTVLVMTMVRDEAEMLPRWLAHYGGQVGFENLLVLDDHTADGSTDDLPCTVHRLPELPGGKAFERARMTMSSGLAAGFLAAYDFVIFVDADELLLPDPTMHADLPSFLASRRERDVIAPMALNVVHVPSAEGPLCSDQPVLGQRRFAKFTPLMCKPAIKQVPTAWRWASHGIRAPFEVDDELYLIHLKFADRDVLSRTAAQRQAMVATDGRAGDSGWAQTAEDVLDLLDRVVGDVDVAQVPEFVPGAVDLASVIQEHDGLYRSVGDGQLKSLRRQPLCRVPSQLLGRV